MVLVLTLTHPINTTGCGIIIGRCLFLSASFFWFSKKQICLLGVCMYLPVLTLFDLSNSEATVSNLQWKKEKKLRGTPGSIWYQHCVTNVTLVIYSTGWEMRLFLSLDVELSNERSELCLLALTLIALASKCHNISNMYACVVWFYSHVVTTTVSTKEMQYKAYCACTSLFHICVVVAEQYLTD